MERYAFLHLRVPAQLKESIDGCARANRRSTTQEIRVALERYVAPAAQKVERTTDARSAK